MTSNAATSGGLKPWNGCDRSSGLLWFSETGSCVSTVFDASGSDSGSGSFGGRPRFGLSAMTASSRR